MKKLVLLLVNIILPIVCFLILLFSKLSDNMFYLIMATVLVGWIIPYFSLIITGLEFIGMKHSKMALWFNILSFLINIINIIFTIRLLDKRMIILLVEYILMMFVQIINIIYLWMYIKKNPYGNIYE